MLTLQNVTIARGARVLIEKIDLTVFEKNVIGFVGANGCGKTSLFAAITGKLDPTVGEIRIKKHLAIGSLEQEVAASDISAIDYVISGDAPLFEVRQRLLQAEEVEDYETIMDCHSKLHELDGYSAEARAAKILIGLGFADKDLPSPVKHFSGGWRVRLSLAKCLFAPTDLLLLDEPTNHLDMPAIIWLENYLRRYSGGIIMVSHDQDFLDNTSTHIAHVEHQRLTLYSGNYSTFELTRAQKIALQNAQHKKQQAKIVHAMKFVDKFRYKASKAKQAQSRLKAVERMELIQPIQEQSLFRFQFLPPSKMANPMLTLRKADFGYDKQAIIKKANISIIAKQRIGLLGVNGAGKSTLIKGLCGELPPLCGTVEHPNNLTIGYFAQHQVDQLPLQGSAYSLLQEHYPTKTERDIISYLGSFAFSREQSLSSLHRFSGGEKARLALALIIWQRPNLLLLDEPTNHLDLQMRRALMFALQSYQGAMILVSHDRHLLRTLVDELYYIEDGMLEPFDGSIDAWQEMYS